MPGGENGKPCIYVTFSFCRLAFHAKLVFWYAVRQGSYVMPNSLHMIPASRHTKKQDWRGTLVLREIALGPNSLSKFAGASRKLRPAEICAN
jgi:hypothetical protein